MNKYLFIGLIAILSLSGRTIAHAQTSPAILHYQAHVMNSAGLNIDGAASVVFWIYDSPTLGVSGDLNDEHLLYAERHDEVRVDRGTLRVSIGEGRPFGRFAGTSLPLEALAKARDLYIELYLNNEKISPRQRFGSNVNSLRSEYARRADSLSGPLSITSEMLPDLPTSKVSGTIPIDRIPLLSSSYLIGQVDQNRIRDGIPLSKITEGTLSNSVLPNMSASKVRTGVFGEERLPTGLMRDGDVKAVSSKFGIVSDGGYLTMPSGFTPDECAWFVALNDTPVSFNTIDNIYVCTGSSWGCNDTGTRVRCVVSKEDGYMESCNARYLIICSH